MHNLYMLNLPSPRTLLSILFRPLLDRLVLWYLRFVIAQQSEINAEFARRLTLLEGELRQGVAGELRAALERLAVLEGERHAVLERLAVLEGELRQGVAGELRATLERLAVLEGERHAVLERLAVLEGELRQGQDALKTQLSALSNELAAQQGHRAMTERIFAHQISCLTELTGSCLLAQAGQARSEQDLSSSTNS
jgi:VIT1/CCC1 family predicted Fe2+/Mn2+ transporter